MSGILGGIKVNKIKLETNHTLIYCRDYNDGGSGVVLGHQEIKVGVILPNGNFSANKAMCFTIEMMQDITDVMIDMQGSE